MMKSNLVRLPVCLASIVVAACAPAAPTPTQAPAKAAASPAVKPAASPVAKVDERAQQTLRDTVAKAQQEGTLTVMISSSAAKVAPAMGEAFKKRFGLTNLDFKPDVSGNETPQFQKALAEHQAGAPPSYDAMQGGEDNIIVISRAGGSQQVENWQLLLAAINPLVSSGQVKAETVSPSPFTGLGFLWSNRTKSLLYNTDLVKDPASQLPKARADMADPKFAGKYAVPTFISEVQYGPLFYDKDRWLDTVDKIGKGAVTVLSNDALFQRMLLGEFEFVPNNTYYYFQARAKDPRAPVGQQFFTDYTAMTNLFYTVRKGAKSPAAGALFSLWMTTPEAQALWQPEAYYPSLVLGNSELDKAEAQRIRESGTKLVTWFDTPETVAQLEWMGTEEGKQYSDRLARAYTQRRQ